MDMKLNKIVLLLLAVFISATAYSGIEKYSTRIEASNIVALNTFDVYDARYNEMNSNPLWMSDFTNYNVLNTVQLGINPEVLQSGTYTAEVKVKITYDHWNLTTFTSTSVTKTLKVNYDAANPTQFIDDKSTYAFAGAHKIHVEIISVNGTGVNVADLYVESTIEIERYHAFDGGQVTNPSYSILYDSEPIPQDNFIEFNWDTKIGAESYELEWVHINDYTLTENVFEAEADLNYDFYLNSTRIEIKNNSYVIPNIFDHGYLIFRVRPIGLRGQNFDYRYDGSWSAPDNGTIVGLTADQKWHVQEEYDPGMNWSHQIGYTEDGKRMEAISFADGLGRGRQSVAHNSETDQAIVSNTYYDELGRPAIVDLPTPVDGLENDEKLKHYGKFNRPVTDINESYQAEYFNGVSQGCAENSLGFDTGYGAGQYYSSQNPDLDGENANIPDAETFPYTRITYMDDYTGRVLRVGSAGESLKIGSGKETRYVYPSSNQGELNRLFGTEVGDYTHYQKMITIDPNGQVYAQYSDMAGRVVATYMMGQNPSNLDPLTSNNAGAVSVELINNGNTQTETAPIPSTTVTYTEFFADDGDYTLNYGFTPAQYQNMNCLAANICFDCVYDLSIYVFDECGDTIVDHTQLVNGITFDEICNGDPDPDFSQVMAISAGEYIIEKKLEVNQASIDEYWCLYLENDTCITPLADLFEAEYILEPFDGCTPELIAQAGDCDLLKEVMLLDVSPGGQYGEYVVVGGAYSTPDPTSVLGNWTTGTYYDDNGILIDHVGWELEDFIINFRAEWAEELLKFHPENCYLEYCYLIDASGTNEYDELMLQEYSFAGALTTGYFNPLGTTPSTGILAFDASSTIALDPFFATGALGAGQAAAFDALMNTYITLDNGGISIPLTMWEYAIYLAMDCTPANALNCISKFRENTDCENNDLAWVLFVHYTFKQKSIS